MNSQTLQVTIGGLLHDVGKLVCRAGQQQVQSEAGYTWLLKHLTGPEWHAVLNCVRWRHTDAQEDAASIIGAANAIASVASNDAEEGSGNAFDATLPLYSVFSHLNGQHPDLTVQPTLHDGRLRLPVKGGRVSPEQYTLLLSELADGFTHAALDASWLDALLALMARCTANVPSHVHRGTLPDVSLFDHLKLTAAVSACISEYLLAQGKQPDCAYLCGAKSPFRREKAFLMYSADFSGIQKFIYTVATKGAQRSLRSRSFFLELLMEHYVDELLTSCGLSRTNLIYSGGGHCYILLPNTEAAVAQVTRVHACMNSWLMQQFGIRLYMAHGWAACSADDLTNTPAEAAPYKAIFRTVSGAISRNKLHRYSPEQILLPNRMQENLDGRECTVCGSTDILRENRCPWCARFEDISSKIQDAARMVYYVTTNPSAGYDMPLPGLDGEVYLSVLDEATARQRLKTDDGVLRVYTKNQALFDLPHSTQLDVCDYFTTNQNEVLAEGSTGIQRLAVCRMDVDNLGHAFVAGFEQSKQSKPAEKYRYVTLSRTAALSRQLSLFFKRYMRQVMTEEGELSVSVIYSGGDDVFLLGAWDHVIQAAMRIQRQFDAFNGGTLTISGGVGIFPATYPIRVAADDTANLEQRAKAEPEKNAVALFDPRQDHTYSWSVLSQEVMGQKLACLQSFFSGQDERGKAFLYRMLDLLREAETERLNLARYAYMLARLRPKKSDPTYALYDDFSKQMYGWACQPQDRHQLITAIYLFVYMTRKAGE